MTFELLGDCREHSRGINSICGQAEQLGLCFSPALCRGAGSQRGAVCAGFQLVPMARFVLFFRKLRATLDEYTTRVGQQAIVLCISPSKPNPVFKVFGAAPLENVVGVPRKVSLTFSAGFVLFRAALEAW